MSNKFNNKWLHHYVDDHKPLTNKSHLKLVAHLSGHIENCYSQRFIHKEMHGVGKTTKNYNIPPQHHKTTRAATVQHLSFNGKGKSSNQN